MALVPTSSSSIVPSLTSSHSFAVKLNHTNYLSWKAQFIPILNYQGLYCFINGTSNPPPKTIPSLSDANIQVPNPAFTT